MSARFECPRCQTVFLGGSDDEAFAECPSCGALALPAGDATTAEIHRALAGSQEATLEGQPLGSSEPARGAAAASPGVFGNLLAEDIDAVLAEPALAEPPREVTVPGAPAPVAPAPVSALDEPAVTPSQLADPTSTISPEAMRALVSAARAGEGMSDEGAPFSDEGAPFSDEGAPVESALPPSLLLTRDDAPELSLEEPAPERTEVGRFERDGVWDRDFHSQEVAPSAVLLSTLEAETQGLQLFDGDALDADAFGALERAFDEVALRPEPAPPLPSRAEDALRAMSASAAMSGVALPVRPEDVAAPAVPEPPSLRRRRAPHLHLTLSEEAKALAGIPLGQAPKKAKRDDAEVTTRLPRARGADAELAPPEVQARPPRSDANEATDPTRRPERRPERKLGAEPLPEAPSPFAIFTMGRVFAIVLLALVVGGLTGVALAPEPERRPNTPRVRAEQRFAEGNRFYQDGRFDDALGSYRGAIALDRTFAPAYRAKAAALAKQQRYEEAAAAYRAYLEAAPGAVDAEAVEEVLGRYEGESGR